MIQRHDRNEKVVALPGGRKESMDSRLQYYLQKLQARRDAGLPVFSEPDKNEPEWITPNNAPVYPVNEKCGHAIDGAVKWTRGEMQYSTESVNGQPGFKSSIVPCKHCTEAQRKIHGDRVMQSRISSESKIPQYTNESTWESLPSNMDADARDEIRDATFASIEAIRNGGKGQSRFVFGDPQLGKTTLAALAAREFMKVGIGVYYVSIREYLQTLKQEAARRYDTHTEPQESIERLALNAPVLIIDDLGAEDGTRYEIGKIFDLIESRLAKGLTTYITSNNSPDALRKKWKSASNDPEVQDQGGRIVERIKKHYLSTEVMSF